MVEYRAMLGKRTKANMSNYSNKLRREFSDFSFTVATGEGIDPSVIREIVAMNRSRMREKKTTSAIDSNLEHNIVEFSRKYGIVGTVRLNGRIAAGTICYRVGDHCYADVIAHDSAYNKYSIGQVCIYLMIQSLIARGIHAFHMAGGECEYKSRLLGVNNDIYFVSIFRSELKKKIGLIRNIGKFGHLAGYMDMLKYNYIGRLKEYILGRN
jgi:CelD/BcsL family acetyltransferase involved in cellulose biosynthesis